MIIQSKKEICVRKGSGRPVSPHLQIYRPQITSVLSILHRLTGMFLFLSAWMWLLFLFSLVLWPAFFWQEGMLRLLMYGFLGGFLIALFYHLLNGIRHLIWDSGRGLDLPFVHRSGKLVLFGTLLLTGGTLWWIL